MINRIFSLVLLLMCIKIADILEIEAYLENKKFLIWITQFVKYFEVINTAIVIIIILFGEQKMVNIRCDNKQCSKCNTDEFCGINNVIHIGLSRVCNFYIKELAKKKILLI